MKNALVACLLGSVFFLSGCNRSGHNASTEGVNGYKISGSTMGTFYEVTLAEIPVQGETELRQLSSQIEQLLLDFNRQMSTYDSGSEISKFNLSTSTDWFSVSPDFAYIVQEAIEIAEVTKGAFDPTVGPLVNLWHFGPEQNELVVPAAETINQIRQIVGYQHLSVRLDPPAIRKAIPELQLDLSAIAKGGGVDRLAELLISAGYRNFLINIGGEVRAAGVRESASPWRVAIEKPLEEGRAIEQVVPLTDLALATSGDYRNFYRLADRKYSHTIDPETGAPVEHQLHSVSVVAANCARADAFATALMVMGPERAWEFSQQHRLLVYLISGEQQPLKIQQSLNFPTLLTGKP